MSSDELGRGDILGRIEFSVPVFPQNTKPNGHLSSTRESQACWYYYILCEKQRALVGNGPEDQIIVVETGNESDVQWMDTHYLATARSIELIYSVSIEDMFKRWPEIKLEALRLGLPEPRQEYMDPPRFRLQ